MGAEQLLEELQNSAGPGVRVVRAPCVGLCDMAPVAEVGHHYVMHATTAEVLATAARGETEPDIPPYVDYDAYVKDGGYKLLSDLRAGRVSTEDILKALDDFQPARARRRRLSHWPQMARGARRARPAADGGQWR